MSDVINKRLQLDQNNNHQYYLQTDVKQQLFHLLSCNYKFYSSMTNRQREYTTVEVDKNL